MDKLREVKNKLKNHTVMYNIIPCLIVVSVFVYYLPIYGITFIDEDVLRNMGERMYGILNPFTITPYIMLGLTILIFVLYDKLWVKSMILVAYIISIVFSAASIMGMTEISDYIVFLPHMIGLFFLGYLEYKSWKKCIGRSTKNRKK